jgi:hypothetical protein
LKYDVTQRAIKIQEGFFVVIPNRLHMNACFFQLIILSQLVVGG